MNKAALNAEYREYAQQITALVAPLLKVKTPRVSKINRRKGWSYRGHFSLPVWIFTRCHPIFRLYYIIHETNHQALGAAGHHGVAFRINESEVMESLGYRLRFADSNAIRKPYPVGIIDLKTGVEICDHWGRPV